MAVSMGLMGPIDQAPESPSGKGSRSKNELIVSTAQEGWKWKTASATNSFTSTFLALTNDSQNSTGTNTGTNEPTPMEKSRDINNQDIAVDIGLAALLRLHCQCDNSSMFKFVSILPKDAKADILQRLSG